MEEVNKGLGFTTVPGTIVIDYTDEHSEHNDPTPKPLPSEIGANGKPKIFDGKKGIEKPTIPLHKGPKTDSGILLSTKETAEERKTLPYTCVQVAEDVAHLIKPGQSFLMRGGCPMELFEWEGKQYAQIVARGNVVVLDV